MRTSLTPLDGRYYDKVSELAFYLSENALINYRARVEILWLKKFCAVTSTNCEFAEFEINPDRVKEIEKEVRHDVKAVEMWLARELTTQGKSELVSLVHFGRTSEDINNLAYALMIKDAVEACLMPVLNDLQEILQDIAKNSANMVMLARTHGQPASPTTFGKEIAVFKNRLNTQIENIKKVKISAKFGGATGTFAADLIAYPDIDWLKVAQEFIEGLGLEINPATTQIEPHDWVARLSNELALANTILIDLCRDLWQYISLGYVQQKVIDGEVGSSTMPHKVNPIDFENAEANFGLSNALLRHFAKKLPISRMQRDLSDSSVMRSHSEAYGHMLLALKSLKNGLSKITPDPEFMKNELSDHWELLTEAVQTVMRKNGIADAYDQMKHISRGKMVTKDELHEFIQSLSINEDDKQRLLNLTPENYNGYSEKLANM